jgi:hypothetical protein
MESGAQCGMNLCVAKLQIPEYIGDLRRSVRSIPGIEVAAL